MQAISYRRYGGPEVVEYGEAPRPEPGEGEVVLRVRAASVNPYEWHYLRGRPYMMRPGSGWRAPRDRRLGVDVAGVVEEAGPGVEDLSPGDEVFGIAAGSLAELAVAQAGNLAPKPATVSFEEAAAVPLAGLTALQGLRDHAGMRAGDRVLVLGASGGVGTFAVQLARELGGEVTAMCGPRNVELVRGLGAARVVDYSSEDVAGLEERFDVILDIAGGTPFAVQRRLRRDGGVLALVGGPAGGRLLGPAGRMFRGLLEGGLRREHVVLASVSWSGEDLRHLAGLLAEGRLRSAIERSYPLAEAARAIAHVEAGHARGKVVVTVP